MSEDYTSIVNVRHYQRLHGLLDDARAKGARVVETGPSPEQANRRAHTIPPTLVLNVRDDMRIMQEEIFGPLLPIVTYRDLDEAIAFVNARPRPLSLYYFGSSETNRTRVLTRTTSGGVTINATLLHYAQEDLQFGGVGPSGFGAYHGIEGFRTFSHQKAVFDRGTWNGGALLQPPFGRLTDVILSWMLRQQDPSRPPIEVHNEIVIRASVERVWDLLTDVERWPTWYRACRWVRGHRVARVLPLEGTPSGAAQHGGDHRSTAFVRDHRRRPGTACRAHVHDPSCARRLEHGRRQP